MNLKWALLVATAVAIPTSGVMANEELMKLEKDPNQWVMPTGDYANHRYSELNQINKDNVKNLRPVWTFSTGVLRGHEGAPLVIGDVMYVHTPFPNIVFALDLNKNGQILWKYEPKQDPHGHPGDVLRHGQPRRRLWRRQDHPRPGRRDASSRSTPRPARRSGASRTAIRRRARR